jgi:hypothetical protein
VLGSVLQRSVGLLTMERFLSLVGLVSILSCLLGADTRNSVGATGMAANNATPSGNPLQVGSIGTAKGSAPATVTAGNMAALTADTERRLLVNTTHPNFISANASAVTATTQILGLSGSGLSYYISDISFFNNVSTAQTVNLVSSTTAGNACATSPVIVTPNIVFGAVANGTWTLSIQTPIKVAANSALCCKASAATSFSCIVSGFIGP